MPPENSSLCPTLYKAWAALLPYTKKPLFHAVATCNCKRYGRQDRAARQAGRIAGRQAYVVKKLPNFQWAVNSNAPTYTCSFHAARSLVYC